MPTMLWTGVLCLACLTFAYLGDRLAMARPASTCVASDFDFSNGFILSDMLLPGNHFTSPKALHIKDVVLAPRSCEGIHFVSFPSRLESPEFKTVPGRSANGRPFFTNGHYLLSYILPSQGRPYGTWIVGDAPGVDRGIGYMVAPLPHLVPCFNVSALWRWIEDSLWVEAPDTHTTCIHPSPNAHLLDAHYLLDKSLQSMLVVVSEDAQGYLDSDGADWGDISLRRETLVPFGAPSLVVNEGGPECAGTLVNSEFLHFGWRLMFHCHSNGLTEVFVNLTDSGLEQGTSVSPLTEEARGTHLSRQWDALLSAKRGQFFWLFYRNGGVVATTRVITVECTASQHGTVLFKIYPDDRREVMRRSLLTYMDELFVVLANHSALLGDHEVEIASALSFGSDSIQWIRKYLIRHEGRFGNLPSCFLYHAAIAMPAPFVYAAEIICVLIGSKPIVMIQVSSSSDHQLKFPLVKFLSHRIVNSVKQIPDFPLGYFKSIYHSDETLVIFNKKQALLAELLVPYRQAQALHIAPYPDDPADNDRIFEIQIYNSWWNGFVLGYPERFIDSYCLDFHNEISTIERGRLMRNAKSDILSVFSEYNLTAAPIQIGLNEDVGFAFWQSLENAGEYSC